MKLSRNQIAWLTIGAVAWVFLTLTLFYWVQKPLGPENAAALGRTALELVVAALIGATGLGIGSWLLHRLRLAGLSAGDRIILGDGLGLGILGLIAFGVGVMGITSRWFFLGLLVVLTVCLWRQIVGATRVIRLLKRPGAGVVLYVGFTLLLALLAALMPSTDWDGLFYHLTGPAWALSAGRIGPPQANVPHLSFSGLMESLFLLAMALRGDVAAKLVHWSFALLLGGLVCRIANRHVGAKLGWGGGDRPVCHADGGRASRLGIQRPGAGPSSKYTAFVCPVTLVALIAWDVVRQKNRSSRFGAG